MNQIALTVNLLVMHNTVLNKSQITFQIKKFKLLFKINFIYPKTGKGFEV